MNPRTAGGNARGSPGRLRRPGKPAEPGAWYVEQGERGERLLAAGEPAQAAEIFESMLARLGPGPSFGRAVVLGRLGRCLHLTQRAGLATARLQQALDVAGRLAASPQLGRLRISLHSELGIALRSTGAFEPARCAHEAALALAEGVDDDRARAVERGHLGALALAQHRPDEAREQFAAALPLFRGLRDHAMEALAWRQLGAINEAGGDGGAAEACYRRALQAAEQSSDRQQAAAHRQALAALLLQQPLRLREARQLAEQALLDAQADDPLAERVWQLHGVIADITDRELATAAPADAQQRAELQAQAHDRRELQRQAPRLVAALARLPASAVFARAVLLGRLAICFKLGGRLDLAVEHLQRAVNVCDALAGDHATALRGALHAQFGQSLRTVGRLEAARRAQLASLQIAEHLHDLRAQAQSLFELGEIATTERDPEQAEARYAAALPRFERLRDPAMTALTLHRLGRAADPRRRPHGGAAAPGHGAASSDAEITVHDDLFTDCVFEPDLLLDRPRMQRVSQFAALAEPLLPPAARPVLTLGIRTTVDDVGAIRFCLPPAEPTVERQPGCTVMQRLRREVAVAGASAAVWRIARAVDGLRTVDAVVLGFAPPERPAAARLMAALAGCGVLDVSGRPIGRYVHAATKKGMLAGGQLDNDDVLRLATDGNYRSHPNVSQLAVGTATPERLRPFHALTRLRRSRRDYDGRLVARADFDALLHTACGVSGSMRWDGREVKLRAYPSSGALYAIEVYPIVYRVAGLEPAVYHYRATDNVLELLRPGIDAASVAAAALPVERDMVGAAAAMICLVGFFARHEQKYGQGGYRMMVAEAGHLSQNLVLAATALGLAARPFGGVFDDLVNHDLGLDGQQEQFLLAVLVGHAGRGAEQRATADAAAAFFGGQRPCKSR